MSDFKGGFLDAVNNCDAVIIMVAHQAYQNLSLLRLKNHLRTPILIDGRRVVDPQEAEDAGLDYFGIGFGSSRLNDR